MKITHEILKGLNQKKCDQDIPWAITEGKIRWWGNAVAPAGEWNLQNFTKLWLSIQFNRRWWIKNDRCGMIRMWGAYIWIFLIALHLYLNHLEVDKASSTGIFSTTYQSQIQSLSCNAITTQHTLNSSIKKVWFTVDIVSAVSLVESDTSSSFKLGHRSPEIHRISVEPPYHWWEDVQMTIKVQLEW